MVMSCLCHVRVLKQLFTEKFINEPQSKLSALSSVFMMAKIEFKIICIFSPETTTSIQKKKGYLS